MTKEQLQTNVREALQSSAARTLSDTRPSLQHMYV